MVQVMGIKIRECAGCQLTYVETKEEEVSRKIKKEKMLCGDCLGLFEIYKQRNNIPPLTYIAEYEPLPFDPMVDETLN